MAVITGQYLAGKYSEGSVSLFIQLYQEPAGISTLEQVEGSPTGNVAVTWGADHHSAPSLLHW